MVTHGGTFTLKDAALLTVSARLHFHGSSAALRMMLGMCEPWERRQIDRSNPYTKGRIRPVGQLSLLHSYMDIW